MRLITKDFNLRGKFVAARRQHISRIRFCGWQEIVLISPGTWNQMPLMKSLK